MFGRLGNALEAARKAVAEPGDQTDQVATGVGPALLILGATGADAGQVAAQFIAAHSGADLPLIISNTNGMIDIRDTACRYDFVPLPSDVQASNGEGEEVVATYVLSRLNGVLDLWGVQTCFYAGDEAETLVGQRWRAPVRLNANIKLEKYNHRV